MSSRGNQGLKIRAIKSSPRKLVNSIKLARIETLTPSFFLFIFEQPFIPDCKKGSLATLLF